MVVGLVKPSRNPYEVRAEGFVFQFQTYGCDEVAYGGNWKAKPRYANRSESSIPIATSSHSPDKRSRGDSKPQIREPQAAPFRRV